MDISQRGIDLIKDYENYEPVAKPCIEGVPTIGWGSIRWDAQTPVKNGDTITKEQAESLLRKEVCLIEDAIDTYVKVQLTQGQFDCLVSWGYNVGIGWINGRREGGAATLIKYLNRGQYERVPSELLKFRKGANSGKVRIGLINRRKREIQELWLYEEPKPLAAEEGSTPPAHEMPQAVLPMPETSENVVASVKSSMTIKGAVAALGGGILNLYSWATTGAVEAAKEAASLKGTLTPFEALFGALKANAGLVASAVIIAGCVIVILRRVSAAKEGRIG